jgi:hypothetical protein
MILQCRRCQSYFSSKEAEWIKKGRVKGLPVFDNRGERCLGCELDIQSMMETTRHPRFRWKQQEGPD